MFSVPGRLVFEVKDFTQFPLHTMDFNPVFPSSGAKSIKFIKE